jgi:hypothetical protein
MIPLAVFKGSGEWEHWYNRLLEASGLSFILSLVPTIFLDDVENVIVRIIAVYSVIALKGILHNGAAVFRRTFE